MKTTLLSLLSTALLAPTVFAQTIVSDNFDSYTPAALAHNTPWGSPIPGTSPALTWQTNPPLNGSNTSGPQAIVAGSVAGRTGNLYHYQENATGQATTFSSVTLPSATGTNQWELSVDFYLDTVNPSGGGWFGILAIGNGLQSTAANQLFNAAVSRQGSNNANAIGFAFGGNTYFADDSDRLATLGSWYTLSITGDNDSGTLIATITGENYSLSKSLAFRNSLTDFNTIAIGDSTANAWTAGRNNSIYIDNFSLRAIPEPSTLALIPAALGLLGTARFIRRRAQS